MVTPAAWLVMNLVERLVLEKAEHLDGVCNVFSIPPSS